MSESPYIPFYTSDFLGGTSGMTAATRGVYITILCLMYETEGPLKQKWEILARRCGCTLPAFKRAISDLEDDGKVETNNGEIWSEKCEKHIMHRRERQISARSAAKTRWKKTKQKQSKAGANALQPQCQPEPESDIREIGKPISCASRPVFAAQDFQDFWDAYPHRNGKKKNRAGAEAAFSRAIKLGATVAQIACGVDAMRRDPDVIRGYARDPTTWLNQRGWTDEIPEEAHENRIDHTRRISEMPANRPDPALANIFRLAGLGEASSGGGG